MLLKAKMQADKPNSMFPKPPTSMGNTAAYNVVVRQNGALVEGTYTLDGIDPSAYDSITCIYYNEYGQEIRRVQNYQKPGSCYVQDDGRSRLQRLEIRANGVSSAPLGGFITLDGKYRPGQINPIDLPSMIGGSNSEVCTSMRVSASNMPDGQLRIDPQSGGLIWYVVPKQFDPNSVVRVRNVLVQSSNPNVGGVIVTPGARFTDGTATQLGALTGQINAGISGFPDDYTMDITCLEIRVLPAFNGVSIDPNDIVITVYYCSTIGTSSAPLLSNTIQPYMPQAPVNPPVGE